MSAPLLEPKCREGENAGFCGSHKRRSSTPVGWRNGSLVHKWMVIWGREKLHRRLSSIPKDWKDLASYSARQEVQEDEVREGTAGCVNESSLAAGTTHHKFCGLKQPKFVPLQLQGQKSKSVSLRVMA